MLNEACLLNSQKLEFQHGVCDDTHSHNWHFHLLFLGQLLRRYCVLNLDINTHCDWKSNWGWMRQQWKMDGQIDILSMTDGSTWICCWMFKKRWSGKEGGREERSRWVRLVKTGGNLRAMQDFYNQDHWHAKLLAIHQLLDIFHYIGDGFSGLTWVGLD